jgi:hypothetical protein
LTHAVSLLVIVSGTAAAAVTGSPSVTASLNDDRVSPGEETTLDIVLANSGDIDSGSSTNPSLNSEVTTARGVTVAVEDGDAPISVTTPEQSLGSLADGATTTVPFDISVDDDADPGTYRVPVEVEYDYYRLISESSGTRYEGSSSRTRYVTVEVTDDATFEVVDIDSDARVDSTGDVALTVQNTGETTANRSSVTLESLSQELTVGGAAQSSRFVESWAPGENRTFRFNVGASDTAEPEPYEFALAVEFDNPDGVRTQSTDNSIGVDLAPEQEFSLSDPSSTLRAGEDGDLEATVTNDGPQTVSGVVVNWDSDHSNLSPEETQYAVGTLEPGESTTVTFGVDASDSARAGPRQFDFAVDYRDQSGDRRQGDTLDVRAEVAEERDEFALEPSNTSVGVGGTDTIDITITNTRDVPLTDISAKLFADSPISAEDDEGFIAELGPGESETITFSVSAEGGALTKTYPVSLDFQYEEPDGDTPVSDTYRVGIDVTSAGGGGGLSLGLIAVVAVVLALGAAGVYRFR